MSPNVLDNVKLVIFDVDGVIFDIIDAIRETVKEGLEKYQIKANLQDAMPEIARVMEMAQTIPIPQMILNAKELLDIKIFEGFTVVKRLRIAVSIYSAYRAKKENCQLFTGIDDIIKGLSAKKYKLAILSNSKKSYVLDALQKKDLAKYFNNILGFNEVTKTKPDPEGLLKILQLENVKPEEALFLGDMMTDIQAGRGAKIRTIAVASGLTEKAKLEGEHPFAVVDNIPNLKQLFGL
jgi:HAD superfamily hydrolase (TIGR01509 family)